MCIRDSACIIYSPLRRVLSQISCLLTSQFLISQFFTFLFFFKILLLLFMIERIVLTCHQYLRAALIYSGYGVFTLRISMRRHV